ncbi:MAG: hypothetical protein N6V49_04015, partial [Serratia symbiotica]|nr:hypothetical protein [Serratia symbiotica]
RCGAITHGARYTEETTVAVISWYIVADVQATVIDRARCGTIGEWGFLLHWRTHAAGVEIRTRR